MLNEPTSVEQKFMHSSSFWREQIKQYLKNDFGHNMMWTSKLNTPAFEADLLNKSSCSALALSEIMLAIAGPMILVTLCCDT
jgi:hypothetical protein